MEDVFKKVLYAGAGLAALATEKVTATIDELVDKGKISDVEGKKILEDFFKNTDSKKNEFEEKLKEVTEEVVSRFDFLKRDDLSEIKDRLADIEKNMNIKTTAKATKKANAGA